MVWRQRADGDPLAPAATGDRFGRPAPASGTTTDHQHGRLSGLAGAGERPAGCHARPALCDLGGDARRGGQSGDDVAAAGQARLLAQKKTLIARERDAAERAAWREATHTLDPSQLVFLDETSTPLTLTPLRARAPRGERAVGRVPRGKRRHFTLVSTLSSRLLGEASVVVEGPADRELFDAYVAQFLVPTLHPGQTVLLDNLQVHKSATARRLIEDAGCTLCFLPRYSPDFNPIEQAFAKVKTALRRAESRTFDDLLVATKIAFDATTPSEIASFFADAGFPLTGQYL